MAIQISRPLIGTDQKRLRDHIPESNKLGDLSIKWRRFGEMALTLLERGEYQRAAGKSAGRLALLAEKELQNDLNTLLLPGMTTGNPRITVQAHDIDFLGEGPYRSIAYILDASQIEQERRDLTLQIDRLNGVSAGWDNFLPHLTAATVPAANMRDDILDTFWEFLNHNYDFTFERASASAS